MTSIIRHCITAASTCIFLSLSAIDNHQFYRASYLFFEPRFERPWLTSCDVSISAGSTNSACNKNHHQVPLLDIYGVHPMQKLGQKIPNLNPQDPRDNALLQLLNTPPRDQFATFSIAGSFNITEAMLYYTQNIINGFFFQLHAPIRSLRINNIVHTDLSPTDDITPHSTTPEWLQFLKLFNDILSKYGLKQDTFKKTGLGDISLLLGWTINYEETEDIDFIDFTCKAGLLAPSGEQKDENQLFAIPLGYNKHWGFPLSVVGSIGFYEWITLGAQLQTLFFVPTTHNIRMKTDKEQSNLIKLTHGLAHIDKGALINAGFYAKADHFVRGLSCTFGYTIAHQQRTDINPANKQLFDPVTVNTDESLHSWTTHTFHIFVEYDFTKEYYRYGPRIGFIYNKPIRGTRIFKTNMIGGTFGLDIAWDW